MVINIISIRIMNKFVITITVVIIFIIITLGEPTISVLGCPNLHLQNVLQPAGNDIWTASRDSSAIVTDGSNKNRSSRSISYVGKAASYPASRSQSPSQSPSSSIVDSSTTSMRHRTVYSAAAGSVFFAVTGRGSFCRSLSMPFGSAFEVEVSRCREAIDSKLCESSEASHGDRDTTLRVSSALKLKSDFIRLDGQCKYCVVGSGAAEGNMRLPPLGYVEKIWDHAPGGHFIMEAGGEMTDLQGRRLDFSKGRMLDASVTGILASNGAMHQQLLSAISNARGAMEDAGANGIYKSSRSTAMN